MRQRNSTVELLRIISMVMIVAHHYAVHGGFQWLPSDATISHFWYNFISMGGRAGVDIFVLITGFYLIDDRQTKIDIRRILKFWGEIFFYSIVCFSIFALFNKDIFSVKAAIKSFFPISFCSWWFASSYFILYLIHPLLNKLFLSIDRIVFLRYIILFTILWCFAPTFAGVSFECNNLLWFIYLYSIAAYIKLNGVNPKFSCKVALITSVSFFLLTYLSSVILMILGTKYSYFAPKISHFFEMQMLPTLIWALSLFIAFISLKPSYNKTINLIASCSFGVYLIHDNTYVGPFLWGDLFHNSCQQGENSIILHSLICILLVYVVCTIIDLLRQKIFEKPYTILVSRAVECIENFARFC